MLRVFRIFLLTSFVFGALGCASVDSDPTKEWTPQRFYMEAKNAFKEGNLQTAIKHYETLEARYPYGRYAEQAQLEVAYVYFKQEEPELALAKLLVAASRGLDAEATLRNLLERQPTDARAALQLAELRSQRLAPDRDRTLSLARRAQRFRAGPEADRLIAELTGATQGARPAGARSSQPGAS